MGLPRRSSTSTGRGSWLSSNTTRLTIMERSIVSAESVLPRNVVLESSWLPTLIVSTAASADSLTCSTSQRTSRSCLLNWKISLEFSLWPLVQCWKTKILVPEKKKKKKKKKKFFSQKKKKKKKKKK